MPVDGTQFYFIFGAFAVQFFALTINCHLNSIYSLFSLFLGCFVVFGERKMINGDLIELFRFGRLDQTPSIVQQRWWHCHGRENFTEWTSCAYVVLDPVFVYVFSWPTSGGYAQAQQRYLEIFLALYRLLTATLCPTRFLPIDHVL